MITKRNKLLSATCVAVMAMSAMSGISVSAEEKQSTPIEIDSISIHFTDIAGNEINGKDETTKLSFSDLQGHKAKVVKLNDFDYKITSSDELVLTLGETYKISQTENGDYIGSRLVLKIPEEIRRVEVYDGDEIIEVSGSELRGTHSLPFVSFNIRKFRRGDMNFDGKIDFTDLSIMQDVASNRGTYTFTATKNNQLATKTYTGKKAFSTIEFYKYAFFEKMCNELVYVNFPVTDEATGISWIDPSNSYSEPMLNHVIDSSIKSNPADVNKNNKLDADDMSCLQKLKGFAAGDCSFICSVKSKIGKKIADATCTIKDQSGNIVAEGKTNANGTVILTVPGKATYTVTTTVKGVSFSEKTFSLKLGQTTQYYYATR